MTADVPQLPWPAVCARRLRRHHLREPAVGATPTEVVAAMCGAHAQVLTAAEWSIGVRIAGIGRDDVRRALWEEHTLVKTFGPRGTVHLLPTHELPMWTGALGSLPQSDNGLPPESRLTPEQTDAVIEAIADALEADELTAEELDVEVVAGPAGGPAIRWCRLGTRCCRAGVRPSTRPRAAGCCASAPTRAAR
jgi:hypothetical protein